MNISIIYKIITRVGMANFQITLDLRDG